MMWAALLAAHLVGLVGYTLLLRKSALSGINKYLLAAVMQTVIQLPTLFFVLTGQVSFEYSGVQWLALLSSSIFLVGLHIFTIIALEHLEASRWTIIFNLRLLLTTVLGYFFLGELPSGMQLLGGLIIFASILMLNIHKNNSFADRAVLIGILVTVWFSAHSTLEKYNVMTVGFEDYMVISGSLATIFLWTIALKSGISLGSLKKHLNPHSLWLFMFRALSAWAFVYAIQFGSLAASNYVSGMSVVLIVILGVLLLGERKGIRQKILATSIAMIGLTFILIGRL